MNRLPQLLRISARRLAACATGVGIAAACTMAPTVPSSARSELAPSGKLRLGLIGNPVLVTRESSGELRGLAVDVGREFSRELGVAFEPILFPTVPKLVEEGKTGGWDITFLTPDPARAGEMDFVAPLVESDSIDPLVTATREVKC